MNRSPVEPVWQPGTHIPQLDGVRGLAILLVTLYRFGKDMPTDSWLGRLLAMPLVSGEHGVELFFVLSGFLITGILVDAKAHSHYFSSFFARRSLRIFPLYFGALALFVGVLPAAMLALGFEHPFAQAQAHQGYLWSYTTNIGMSLEDSWCFGPLDHFWSLAVEEHFYLVWPLVVYFCSTAMTLRLAVGLACVCAAARIGWSAAGLSEVAPAVLTIFRCDALLMGAALALLARSPLGLGPWRKAAFWIAPVMLAVGLLLDASGRRVLTLGLTVWPLAWVALLGLLLTSDVRSLPARLLRQGWLLSLGRTSYAMYVFQSPLIPLAGPVLGWLGVRAIAGGGVAGHLAWMAVMFALTYGLAQLSWHAYEKHWLSLKRWFPMSGAGSASRGLERSTIEVPGMATAGCGPR
ncbi:MAG: acyltransferase family protein [Aureliella sp.]